MPKVKKIAQSGHTGHNQIFTIKDHGWWGKKARLDAKADFLVDCFTDRDAIKTISKPSFIFLLILSPFLSLLSFFLSLTLSFFICLPLYLCLFALPPTYLLGRWYVFLFVLFIFKQLLIDNFKCLSLSVSLQKTSTSFVWYPAGQWPIL